MMREVLEFLDAIQIERNEKQISCRLQVYTEDDWKKTLDLYSELSATSWNVRDTFPNAVRSKLRKTYVCHHNQRRQKGNGYKTDTKCPAQIDVKIKLITKHTRLKDKLVDSHPCIVIFKHVHNHPLDSAQFLRQLKLTTKSKNMLYGCFEGGMTASQVSHWLEVDSVAGDVFAMANNQLNPKYKSIFYYWGKWRTKNCGTYTGIKMFDAIENLGKLSEADITVKRFDESFVCAIVTPLMVRVNKYLKQAHEIVFVDTTSHLDQTNTSLTILLCASGGVGALPLGVFVSSSQDEKCYYEGFSLLKQRIKVLTDLDMEPKIFMTDDSNAERNAIKALWPTSTLLLCIFHVLQAVWRWLLDSKHGVNKDNRKAVMEMFRNILYSSTNDQVTSNYNKLVDGCKEMKSDKFLTYVDNLMGRQKEWCISDRKHLLTRGNNTNNFSEATIRIIKDVVFNRCKAFNACEVVTRIVKVFSPYMKGRLMRAALKKSGPRSTNVPIISDRKIVKLSEFLFQVESQSVDGQKYEVDVESGTCTCFVGSNGKLCKHHQSVLAHRFVMSNYFYGGSPEEKQKLALIALGADEVPHISFFQNTTGSQHQSESENDHIDNQNTTGSQHQGESEGDHIDNVIATATDQMETAESEVGFESGGDHRSNATFPSASQMETEPTRQDTRSEQSGTTDRKLMELSNNRMFEKIFNVLRSNTDMASSETGPALKKFLSSIVRVRTPSQLISFYHGNPGSLPHRNSGRKIPVQPTSIARRRYGRPRGIAPLGKGRPPSSLARTRAPPKRQRNLALNIRLNQGNAKSH